MGRRYGTVSPPPVRNLFTAPADAVLVHVPNDMFWGKGCLYSPRNREGSFSETHIPDRECLSNRTGGSAFSRSESSRRRCTLIHVWMNIHDPPNDQTHVIFAGTDRGARWLPGPPAASARRWPVLSHTKVRIRDCCCLLFCWSTAYYQRPLCVTSKVTATVLQPG